MAYPSNDPGTMMASWTFRGARKWKEFIDGQHHPRGAFAYDEYDPDGNKLKNTPGGVSFLEGFFLADDYARRCLGKQSDSVLYERLHLLCMLHNSSRWRGGEVKWAIAIRPEAGKWSPEVNEMKVAGEGNGLRTSEEPTGDGRVRLMAIPPDVAGVQKMRQMVDDVLAKYASDILVADRSQAIGIIARVYQRLEVLHPFVDGTSRTNHLMMNKMLVENGMYPVILRSPCSPCLEPAQWEQTLTEARDAARREVGAPKQGDEGKKVSDAMNSVHMVSLGLFGGDSIPDWFGDQSPTWPRAQGEVRTEPAADPPSGSTSQTSSTGTDELSELAGTIDGLGLLSDPPDLNPDTILTRFAEDGVTVENAARLARILIDEYGWSEGIL